MTVTASLVQLLHRINRQKTDLKGQLERGPKMVQMAQAKLQVAQNRVDQIQQNIKQMKMDADSKQLQLRERESKIHNLEGKLNAAKENREYQTLKEQIAADRQANAVLSDEILEILERIDQVVVQLGAAKESVGELQLELERISKQVADKKVVLESELSRVESELAEAESQLSGDFIRDYQRLVAARGEDAMAELEGKCCSGCYQMLTPQLLERLSIGHPIICASCGRLIYHSRD